MKSLNPIYYSLHDLYYDLKLNKSNPNLMDNQSSGTDVDAQLHVNQYIIPMLASGTKIWHERDNSLFLSAC